MEAEIQKILNLANGPYSIVAVVFVIILAIKNKSIVDLIRHLWNKNLNKISFITDQINNLREDDLEKEVLSEKRDQLVFRVLFGITANKFKREYLIKLYKLLDKEISLESICMAEKYILYSEGEYKIKMFSNWEKIKYYFNAIFFLICYFLGIGLMMAILLLLGKQSFAIFIISVLIFLCVFGMGVFIVSGNWPMIYARTIKEVLKIKGVNPAL